MNDSDGPVYALNLFDVADREEYLAYSRRSAAEVAAHGGRVVALGRFRDSVVGDIALGDLHAHRENGTSSYVWHVFDRLEDLRPILRP
jgi:uncharacterized protein (DUF1330 family)